MAMGKFSGIRFAIEMAAGYVVYSSLAVVGHLARPALGEVADILAMSALRRSQYLEMLG